VARRGARRRRRASRTSRKRRTSYTGILTTYAMEPVEVGAVLFGKIPKGYAPGQEVPPHIIKPKGKGFILKKEYVNDWKKSGVKEFVIGYKWPYGAMAVLDEAGRRKKFEEALKAVRDAVLSKAKHKAFTAWIEGDEENVKLAEEVAKKAGAPLFVIPSPRTSMSVEEQLNLGLPINVHVPAIASAIAKERSTIPRKSTIEEYVREAVARSVKANARFVYATVAPFMFYKVRGIVGEKRVALSDVRPGTINHPAEQARMIVGALKEEGALDRVRRNKGAVMIVYVGDKGRDRSVEGRMRSIGEILKELK
jgi:hypothetical protein